jgi:hypothetical protein
MPSRWPRQQVRIQRGTYPLARMRRRRRVAEWHRRAALRQRPLAVDRFPHRVEHAAEPGRRGPHLACGVGDDGAATAPDPVEAGERHHHGIVPGEADHLGGDGTGATGLDHDPRADRHRMDGPRDLDHQPAHTHHPAIYIDAVDVADLFRERLHCENLKFRRISPRSLTSCLPASLIIASLSLVTESARLFRTNTESRESVRPVS